MRLKSWAAVAIAAGMLAILPDQGRAQTYPDRPVKILIAFSPAGAIDILGRLIAEKLSQKWGQQVVVESRTGAGGHLAGEMVARSPGDGHTILFGTIAIHGAYGMY